MHSIHTLNEKIADNRMVIGSHVGFDSPFVTEMIGCCGFDFIWIDAEHGAMDKKDIQLHLLACRASGIPGIVRVPWNDFVFIKAVLDMGADGIIVPMIRTVQEAEAAVAATTYPPEGVRGMGLRRAVKYCTADVETYVSSAREKVWTILQIEHIDMVDHLDTIAAMPGVTGFVVGPKDFSMSMAQKDKTCTPSDPEAREQFDRIGEILSRHGKPFGVSGVYSESFVKDWTQRGVNFMCLNFDFHYITHSGRAVLNSARADLDAVGRQY